MASRQKPSQVSNESLALSQLRYIVGSLILPLVLFFLTRHVSVAYLGFTQSRGDILAALVAVVTIHILLIAFAVKAFREETEKRD